ncbi:prepilin-type N-terminal cleavage/methylation domain-containing protein [Rheinheimera nanhaiensis]|uniref:Type II secretory pathway, pseudopilin n=1 Tax=Rheinheimera nanhaiensis E407-8 TaxID=562729 RepID=I1DW91_9GAMM|nr:prepilin-type N-terminal cleavage/methylation domain-containing protein [Rheinheimera nanhaiensis]GAB58319.1 type II secretory pathway, pseudopilin [Rheinheimera nanhaiensis E407-8]
MKRNQGFTLIELIIVIVILGILAVTAAPRFFNFAGDARVSVINGLKGAIQGATQTVYAKAAIEGKLGAGPETLTAGSITVVYGYPNATLTGIVNASSLNASAIVANTAATTDWVYLIDGTSIYLAQSSVIGQTTADVAGITGKNCHIQYTNATNADTPPVIAITTSGCNT